MRKAVNGLSIIVSDNSSMDPSNGDLFIFCSKYRNRIKVLFWHNDGYCIFYESLATSTFKIPTNNGNNGRATISKQQLYWLLEGVDINKVKPLPTRSLPRITF